MENKAYVHLLELLRNHIQTKGLRYGLCATVVRLWYDSPDIYIVDIVELQQYILRNRPKWYQKGYSFRHRNDSFFWEPGEVEPRIAWLNRHIKKNSKL